MAKLLRRGKGQQRHDWSNNGSFISRPPNGWLHPDEQLSPNAGICYGVRVRSPFSDFFGHITCIPYAFSALTLLVGRQEGHPACKN